MTTETKELLSKVTEVVTDVQRQVGKVQGFNETRTDMPSANAARKEENLKEIAKALQETIGQLKQLIGPQPSRRQSPGLGGSSSDDGNESGDIEKDGRRIV